MLEVCMLELTSAGIPDGGVNAIFVRDSKSKSVIEKDQRMEISQVINIPPI